MKVYSTSSIRNVALLGHLHAGKTQLLSAMLQTAGQTNRMGRPEEGTATTDFDGEEQARQMSLQTAVAPVLWGQTKVNCVDTPGFHMFQHETKAALVAADAAIVVVDALAGVAANTERVWALCEEQKLPVLFYVNKLDKELADYGAVVANLQEVFGRQAVPVYLPIGASKEFTGVLDLLTMRSWSFAGGSGKAQASETPAAMQAEGQAAHEALVETVAEGKDALLEQFFAEGTLPLEPLLAGLQEEFRERRIFPIVCGSAAHNIGTSLLLDLLTALVPNPAERGNAYGEWKGERVVRAMRPESPASVYIFKTLADPFAGRISLFRVVSGTVRNDGHLTNGVTGADERLAHLSVPVGKTLEPVNELQAGDIGAVAKLKESLTGHTLFDKASPILYPPPQLPAPSIAYAVSAKSRNDEDRLGQAVHRLMEEDSCLHFDRDPQTKEFLLHGTGQTHIEVAVSKLRNRYHIDVALHAPKVPYRETIRSSADVQGRHKKQTGGHGQFGDCWIRMTPLDRGQGFQFENEVFGGAIPKNFIPAIEKGIRETADRGFLAGYPLVDFKVTVYDGSYHDVDSSEMAFKMAARKAFKAAMQTAKPSLLEPVMAVEITAPVEFAGDLMSDISGRRGRVTGMEVKGTSQIILAEVPMAEMLTYQNDLTAITQGRGSYQMEFHHYDFVPPAQADKIVATAKAHATVGEEEEE